MRRALLAAALVAACGDDADVAGPVTYDVVLVVGAAVADPRADTSAFPGEGSDFTEPWTLDCDDLGCTLTRAPAAPLGALEELRLERSGEGDHLEGVAEGVTAAPAAEDSECRGSPAETWTVEIELTMDDEVLVGSVFRIPDALVAGDCFGLDLTMGLSGTRRG